MVLSLWLCHFVEEGAKAKITYPVDGGGGTLMMAVWTGIIHLLDLCAGSRYAPCFLPSHSHLCSRVPYRFLLHFCFLMILLLDSGGYSSTYLLNKDLLSPHHALDARVRWWKTNMVPAVLELADLPLVPGQAVPVIFDPQSSDSIWCSGQLLRLTHEIPRWYL